ncbi:cytochrome b/b6 domain-containing protein [Croceibacterium xixiisoli]|nr:cytochrome b/b6 domain-containing protein [Croceibacterium xixiisoli]
MNTDEPMGIPAPAADGARYSSVAMALHWLIALALAFQLALGFAMPRDASGFALYQFHKSIGITILLLTVLRIVWRLMHRPPPAVEGGFNGFLAKAVHVGLYVFMIGAPLTGWAMVSTDALKIPTMLFGAIPWPHLPLPAGINGSMEDAHELLAWFGIALFLLHVAGALRHQLVKKDNLLRRMAPGGAAAAAFGLLALVVVTYFGTGMYVASTYLVPSLERQQTAEALAVAAPEAVPEDSATPEPEATPSDAATPEAEASEAAAEEDTAAGPPPVWAIQPGKRLGFTIDNGSGGLRGSFSDWSGTIQFDPDNSESADIRISIKLASASMGDATQDDMLQGAEFFGTAANPTATWRSTSVRKTGTNRYSAQGTLSLNGASRPQSLSFTLSGSGLRRNVEGSATIDRNAFKVGVGSSAEGLAPNVALSFAFDAVGRAP